MSKLTFDWSSRWLIGRDGSYIKLSACPITVLADVSESLSIIQNILSQNKGNFEEYFELDEFKVICELVLNNHRILINNLTTTQIESLVIDGGLLATINELTSSKSKINPIDKPITLCEYEAKTVTSIINLGLATNLKEALEIANTFPHDKLRAYLNARILQVDPEYEIRKDEDDSKSKMFGDLGEEIRSGDMFNLGDREARRSALMGAMGYVN